MCLVMVNSAECYVTQARPLDIYVEPLAFNALVFDLPENAIITAEIERWEKTPLTDYSAIIKTSLINMYLDYWPIVLLKNPCLMN